MEWGTVAQWALAGLTWFGLAAVLYGLTQNRREARRLAHLAHRIDQDLEDLASERERLAHAINAREAAAVQLREAAARYFRALEQAGQAGALDLDLSTTPGALARASAWPPLAP